MSNSSHSTGASTPDVPPHIKPNVIHLETIARGIMTAINHPAELDSSLLSDHIDPLVSAAPVPPWDSAPMDLKDWRDYVSIVIQESPEYEIKILGLETHVNDRVGTANVFMNFQVTGVPPRVVRQSVGCIKFRKGDGRWRLFGYEGVDGIEGSEGVR